MNDDTRPLPPLLLRLLGRRGRLAARRPAAGQRPMAERGGGLRLTAGGLLFSIAALAIGLAASSTGNNLAFMFFSMMLAFLAMSVASAWVSLRGLSVDRVVPRHVHAGERFAVTLILHNRKRRLSAYSIRAIDRLDDGRVVGACYSLCVPPQARVESSYLTRIARRGLHRLRSVRVVSSYPFGFFRRSANLAHESEIVVFPRVLPARTWALYSPVPLGLQETPRKGMGAEFLGLRDYQEGDDARRIHWKVSARTNRLVAREFEEEENKRVTLLFDNGLPPGALQREPALAASFERAVVACASLASAYLERGYETQLLTRSGRVPMSVGRGHLQRVLRSLALVQPVAHDGPPLWLPPPARDEAHIVIHYTSGPPVALPPGIHVFSVRDTPPFAELELEDDGGGA